MNDFDASDVFVDANNTVYFSAIKINQVLVLSEGGSRSRWNISAGRNKTHSVFATINGDVYLDNGRSKGRVDKWIWNTNISIPVMNVTSQCIDLFIDIYDTLYCSNDQQHQIVKASLVNGTNETTITAGNGTNGTGSYMLNAPSGIFVDSNLNLYVADYNNHRIQLFQSGQLNGSTVAGKSRLGSITLNGPTDVILDFDGNLFITDSNSNRIVRSGPHGNSCIVGCSNSAGTQPYQLHHPQALSFDSFGNIFVVNWYNGQIQKFLLKINSCSMYDRMH